MKKHKKVFTCPETDDLTGTCRLCGYGLDYHDSDYACLETKTAHTPTPWRLSLDGENIMASTSLHIAEVTHSLRHMKKEEMEANAEFIVLAVNSFDEREAELKRLKDSHEALLEAVKDLRYAFYVENSPKKLKAAFMKHAERLKEIIAQAEGK